MSLITIKAIWGCDECGCQFHTELDESASTSGSRCAMDLAEDSINYGSIMNSGSIRDGVDHICPNCTHALDKEGTDSAEK